MAATSAASFAFGLMPAPALAFVSLSMTCFFLASIWLRLFAGAASTACGREPYRPRAGDRWLPAYSIVVALHREARVVPHLIAALDAIDYPGIMAQTPQAFLRRRTISIEVRNNLGDSAMPKSVQIEDIDKEVKKLKTNVDENTKEIKKTNRHLDEVAAAVKALEDRVKKLEAGHS
jgi:cellulose synthase/poly-beta-1,6-N-acetylglucosamine synthase-like glycosyltransferase